MISRHTKLGIKQRIQKHWMDRVVTMMLDGYSEEEIRSDLDAYLSTQKQSGGLGKRGQKTYGMAIGILACWFAPANELISFRDRALELIRNKNTRNWLPHHWAVISASYPFWFNVAKQTGRLLNLQSQVKQSQIFARLKEQYGDRESVARNARYTVRSFISWEVIKDADEKGNYIANAPIKIESLETASLLIEAALFTEPEGKASLDKILSTPAFFPFTLPFISGEMITQHNDNINAERYSLDHILLVLKDKA